MDPFEMTLAPEPAAEPLPVAPQMPQPPQPQQASWKSAAPLLALLPLAMKQGGQAGVAALLQGWQQGQLLKQQQGQQNWQNQRTAAMDSANLDYRNRALQSQEEARRQAAALREQQAKDRMAQAIERFRSLVPDVQSEDEARSLIDTGIAQGLPAELVTNTVMQGATPTRIERNAAARQLKSLKDTWGEKWAEVGQQMVFTVGNRQVPFQELMSLNGMAPANGALQMPAKADDPVKSSLEVQAADALRRGDMVEYQRLLKVKREIGMADDRPPVPQTIVVQTVDQNGNPVVRVVPKVAGAEFATQPTATQQTAIAEQQTSLQQIGDIERLFKPEYVGPVVGRANQAKMALPGTDVPEDVALFYSTVAAMRNEIIKLMSGAAVSGSEEQRMRDQLPQVTDKPSVFMAKVQQTKQNRERLLAAMTRKGQPQPGQAQPVAPGPNPFRK